MHMYIHQWIWRTEKERFTLEKCVIILYLLYSLLQLSMDPALLLFRAFFDLSSILQKTETRHLIAFNKILKPYDSANQHWIVKLKKNQIIWREKYQLTFITNHVFLTNWVFFRQGKSDYELQALFRHLSLSTLCKLAKKTLEQ